MRFGAIAVGAGLALAYSAPGHAYDFAPAGPEHPLAKLSVRSAMSTLPATGYFPVRLALENLEARAHHYRIETRAQPAYVGGDRRTHTVQVEVPPGQARTFEVLAPLGVMGGGRASWASLDIEVRGGPFGLRTSHLSTRVPGASDRNRPSIGFGASLSEPEKILAGAVPGEVHAVSIEPELLPEDPRALMGLDALWLTDEEVRKIPGEATRGVLGWLVSGGDLVLLAAPEAGPPANLPIPEAAWARGAFGMGRLIRIDVTEPGAQGLESAAGSLRARVVVSEHQVRTLASAQRGTLVDAVPAVQVRRGRILGFLGALALLIGPLNLFVIAPRKKRVRLLWSTPLLSVGASLLLVGLILTEDGVGGSGDRAQVVLVIPELALEHRVQVQASRTGLIPFSGFELAEDLHIEALGVERDDGLDLRTGAGVARGDWFRTRSVQSHLLSRFGATRARVELVSESGAPALRSSLPVPLSDIFLTAPDGTHWRAERLAPGQTVSLQPTNEGALRDALVARLAHLPGQVQKPLYAGLPAPGWLFADAEPAGAWATLDAVRFEDVSTLWVTKVGGGQNR